MPTLRLPGVNVGEVHLHERETGRTEGVAKSETRMTVCPGIHDHPGHFTAPRMYLVDELPFAVRLVVTKLHPERGGHRREVGHNVRQRRRPVDRRLPRAEKIEVGPVE